MGSPVRACAGMSARRVASKGSHGRSTENAPAAMTQAPRAAAECVMAFQSFMGVPVFRTPAARRVRSLRMEPTTTLTIARRRVERGCGRCKFLATLSNNDIFAMHEQDGRYLIPSDIRGCGPQ